MHNSIPMVPDDADAQSDSVSSRGGDLSSLEASFDMCSMGSGASSFDAGNNSFGKGAPCIEPSLPARVGSLLVHCCHRQRGDRRR